MKKIYTQPRIETIATVPQQMLCASGGIKAQIFSISPSGDLTEVYVALFPQPEQSYIFTVTSTTGDATDGHLHRHCYGSARCGRVRVATGLKLTKVNP